MILDDHDPRADRDLRPGVDRIGVEVFAAATDREHDLADPTGTDRPRHPPDFSDHLVRDCLPPRKTQVPTVPDAPSYGGTGGGTRVNRIDEAQEEPLACPYPT